MNLRRPLPTLLLIAILLTGYVPMSASAQARSEAPRRR